MTGRPLPPADQDRETGPEAPDAAGAAPARPPRPNRLLEIAAGLALAALATGALLGPWTDGPAPGSGTVAMAPAAAPSPERTAAAADPAGTASADPARADCALLTSPRDTHVRRTLAELRTSVAAMRRLAGETPPEPAAAQDLAPDRAETLCAEAEQ